MIIFSIEVHKMLWVWIISSLFIVAIDASGEFSVLSTPDSIDFEGNDVLRSAYVDDVLNAAVGNAISGEADWAGMVIRNPFNLARKVIAVHVDGVDHLDIDPSSKIYPMEGDDVDESLTSLIAYLEADNIPVCDINFIEFEEGVSSYRNCFDDISLSVNKTLNLNPTLHSEDKQFLESMSMISAIPQNLYKMQIAPDFLILRLSLEPIAKAHGHKSEAMNEAAKMIAAIISNFKIAFQKSNENNVLLVSIANKSFGRYKRQTGDSDVHTDTKPEEDYNIAPYYDEDYPVIFNIVLWFMITFGFALLAICYAIGTMDPGRDSIIYRMTSTRMKKDN